MLNKLLLALFAAVVAFGGYLTWLFATRDPQGGCDHEILAEAVSPDRRYTAFVEMFDCGALVGGNQIVVEKLGGDARPVKIAQTALSRPCADRSCVTIRWTSPTSIAVSLCAEWGQGRGTALVDGQEITVDIANTCKDADAAQSNK